MTTSMLRKVALGGFVGFYGLLALATALQPGTYRSTRDFVSGLAATDARFGWVMIAGFQAAAVQLVAVGLLLFRLLPNVPGRIAGALTLLAGAGFSVAGFARFDCGHNDAACLAQIQAGLSWHSHLHGLAAQFVFPPLVLATLALAVALWRRGVPYRLVTIGAAAAQFALMVAMEPGTPAVGLLQRLDTLIMLGLPLLLVSAPTVRLRLA